MRIRHWLRIIESSSIWADVRDYWLRFTFKPSIITDFLRSRSEQTYFEGYSLAYGRKVYRKTSGIYIRPGSLILSGGYPLNNIVHLEGRVSFTSDLFYRIEKDYIKNQYRYQEYDSLFIDIRDTTVTDSQFKLEEYDVYYSLGVTYYVLYDFDLGFGFSGRFSREEHSYEEGVFYNSWSNTLSVGGDYYFRNRFIFSLSGSIRRSRSESSYRFDSVKTTPSASFGVSYRLF